MSVEKRYEKVDAGLTHIRISNHIIVLMRGQNDNLPSYQPQALAFNSLGFSTMLLYNHHTPPASLPPLNINSPCTAFLMSLILASVTHNSVIFLIKLRTTQSREKTILSSRDEMAGFRTTKYRVDSDGQQFAGKRCLPNYYVRQYTYVQKQLNPATLSVRVMILRKDTSVERALYNHKKEGRNLDAVDTSYY